MERRRDDNLRCALGDADASQSHHCAVAHGDRSHVSAGNQTLQESTQTRRWTPAVNDPSQAAELKFTASGPMLIVSTPITPDNTASELPLVSQYLLAEGRRR